MPRARKTWAEKMKAIPPHPSFQAQTRRENNCDASCPVSTSIFLRIVAEHTWEEFSRTGSTKNLAPFWRVMESSSTMAKKLNFDSVWIGVQQELEKKNS